MENKNIKEEDSIEETKKEVKKVEAIEKHPSPAPEPSKDNIDIDETPETKEKTFEKEKPETPKEVISKEAEAKKDIKKSPKKKDSDFNYIIRIANTDIDGEKKIIFGLTQIKGLGRRMATFVADLAGIDRRIKCGNLSDSQLEKINEVLKNLDKKAPSWSLNHRKDFDTGKDIHILSSDVDMRLRDDINLLKMIRSYRGIRHETGLRVRGQRTRANNRKGLALGVSKKGQ